jgi:IS30 family transposase
MKTLEQFKKKYQPDKRVSQLENFRDEIFELYEENYTVEQIVDFLQTQNVHVTVWGLYKFLGKKELEKKPKVAQKNEPIKEAGEMSQATKMFIEKHLK